MPVSCWPTRSPTDYYDRLDTAKIIYQDIAFHSWFALDDAGMYSNNTCYFVPGADLALRRSSKTYWQLDAPALIAEVKRAGAERLTPAAQQHLLAEHARQVGELRPILARMRTLEIELQHLVFDLYGLTPEEVQLLRSTAPPRDPLALVEAAVSG